MKKVPEDEQRPELEQLQKQNDELRSQLRLRDAKDAVTAALVKAESRSPELLWKTLQGDLEFDENGQVKNLDALVAGLKTSYPDQFGSPEPAPAPVGSIDAGIGHDQRKKALTKADIQRMTPDEINKNWSEISEVMSSGK